MRTAIAQLISDSGITDGAPGPERTLRLQATRKINVNEEIKTLSFRDDLNRPAALWIRGQRVFDLDKPTDKHNFNLLSTLMALPDHEDLKEKINLINPQADADVLGKRFDQEFELHGIIAKHASDEEWLRKVYRRVIGPSSGLPIRAMSVALLNKLKESPDRRNPATGKYGVDHFIHSSGNWIFEGDFFETRSLLDLAMERGVLIIKDGAYRLKSDEDRILAMDEAKMLHILQSDASIREHIREKSNEAPNLREQPKGFKIEDSELVRKLDALSDSADVPEAIIDPKTDNGTAAIEALVTKVTGTLIHETETGFTIEEVPGSFENRQAVIDFLVLNPQQVASLNMLAE